MYWGREWPRYWATPSGVVQLCRDEERLTLAETWHWWAGGTKRLPRGRYLLSPQLCPLRVLDLPPGLALRDVPALAASCFASTEAHKIAWQPLAGKRLLLMAVPRAIWGRLPFWPAPESWLTWRFNRARHRLGNGQWQWLCVYPEGACLFLGEGRELSQVQVLPDWQAMAAMTVNGSTQCRLDDPFGMVHGLAGWERVA